MYNPKSMKAEEFIDHQEILDTLAYADEHKKDAELISAIISAPLWTLSVESLSNLIFPRDFRLITKF